MHGSQEQQIKIYLFKVADIKEIINASGMRLKCWNNDNEQGKRTFSKGSLKHIGCSKDIIFVKIR